MRLQAGDIVYTIFYNDLYKFEFVELLNHGYCRLKFLGCYKAMLDWKYERDDKHFTEKWEVKELIPSFNDARLELSKQFEEQKTKCKLAYRDSITILLDKQIMLARVSE